MTLFEIDPLSDRRWDGFIEQHPNSSVFHRAEWLNALKNTYGYVPAAITSCRPDSPLTNAIVFCRIKSVLTGSRLVSLPFSDHCDVLLDGDTNGDTLFEEMKRKVDQEHWGYVEGRPLISFLSPWRMIRVSSSYAYHRIDLHPPLETLFDRLHKDCVQRKIRRAWRESLRYEAGTSETLVRHFYDLMVRTRRRQNLPPQPLKWFRSLVGSFGERLKIRVVYKDQTPVAGILTLTHRDTLTYKYGASNAVYHSLGGMALLFWETIREARAAGFTALDLGRSDPDNAGLIAFKERLGAERTILTYWRYPESGDFLRWQGTGWLMQKIVPMIPNRALTALGGVLYRHIG